MQVAMQVLDSTSRFHADFYRSLIEAAQHTYLFGASCISFYDKLKSVRGCHGCPNPEGLTLFQCLTSSS
jgi:hypothetical protein